jgi:hypothetical protein
VSYKRARKTAHINVTASGFGYIQAKSSREATGSGTGNRTIAFNSNVAAGSVVFAVFRAASAGTGLSISDSLGNTWNAVTGDNYARYCITNGAGAMTITFNNTDTPAAPGNLWTAGIIEYSGPPTAVPFDSQHDTPFPPDMAPTTTSPVLVSGTNNLMIGVVTSNIDSPTMFAFTPQAGFATRISETTEAGNGDSYMFVWDKLSVSVNTVISGTLDNNSSWSCYGFSFKLV